MKFNLGCGKDHRPGYVNVDFVEPADWICDLSSFPWPWRNGEAEEILMLDFLEHFSYRLTDKILLECWRVLRPGGTLVVQVPDFEHCARAAVGLHPFLCNRCGTVFAVSECPRCFQKFSDVREAALRRLYGGQDRKGNWHHFAFTFDSLKEKLEKSGFANCQQQSLNQNGESFYQNWNIMITAVKNEDLWK